MSNFIDPISLGQMTYNGLNTPKASKNSEANFSDILSGLLRDSTAQAAMPGMSGLNGIGGMDGMLGGIMPPATMGMENALIATAEAGEMSGPHLMLFMMIMMMQTGDSASNELAPILQMITHMLAQSVGDTAKAPVFQPNELQTNDMLRSLDTDPRVKRMVEAALEQVGYHEKNRDGSKGSGNMTKFGAWYGMDGQPWCAMFVSWAADQAGLLNDTVPRHASTALGVQAYKEKGLYATRNSDYIPKEGDAVYFRNKSGRISHVGIVVAYDQETNRVYTVEGNTNNAVRLRHYDMNNPRIDGFGKNGGTSLGSVPRSSTSGDGARTV